MNDFKLENARDAVLAGAISFPSDVPGGYEMLAHEPRYDTKRHLALEPPQQVWTLTDLGYDAADVERWHPTSRSPGSGDRSSGSAPSESDQKLIERYDIRFHQRPLSL